VIETLTEGVGVWWHGIQNSYLQDGEGLTSGLMLMLFETTILPETTTVPGTVSLKSSIALIKASIFTGCGFTARPALNNGVLG